MFIPSESELKQKVKLVEVPVTGSYWAQVGDLRRKKNYSVIVRVPEKFNKSDLRRATPKVLENAEEYGDFIYMRTFEQAGEAKKIKDTVALSKLYSDGELKRFAKLREQQKDGIAAERKAMGDIEKGIAGDTSDYDPDTGLPPVINDGPIDDEQE